VTAAHALGDHVRAAVACSRHHGQSGVVTAADGSDWTRVAFPDGSYCEGHADDFAAEAVDEVRPELTAEIVRAVMQAADDQDDDPTGEGRAAADDYLREPDTDPDDDDLADFDREVSEGWVDDSGLAVEWAEAAEDFVANLPADQDDGDSPEVTS